MKTEKENTPGVSRKKFLNICGSLIAGGSIVGISGLLLRNSTIREAGYRQAFSPANVTPGFVSPYKLISSFSAPGKISSFEVYGDRLILSVSNKMFVYDKAGTPLGSFSIQEEVRDVIVDNDLIYVLHPMAINVFTPDGEKVRQWEACSPESDYCSFTIAKENLYAADAGNKNICMYTTEGKFVKFIQSPNRFVIPSYTFGITHIDGIIYCSNPGRHQVESYSLDGDYIAAFGKPGGAAGMFCGCCNPAYLSSTSTGDIITSEKGNPRISCYSRNGQFRNILLDSKALGGGNTAYDVKVREDKIFVAGNNLVSIFQYDQMLAAKTPCSACKVNCPLREGIQI